MIDGAGAANAASTVQLRFAVPGTGPFSARPDTLGRAGGVHRATPPGGYRRTGSTAAGDAYPRPPADDRYPRPERTPLDQALPGLRRATGEVLVALSLRQALDAWARRRRDPLGPHALLLLFAEPPAGRPPACTLRCGCRTFFADDEARLAHLLDQIRVVAGQHAAAGSNLRSALLNWCEDMSPAAFYAGVGVVSLDTPTGTWHDVQRQAGSDMDVPGRGYAVLGDGTHLLVNRRALNDLGDATLIADQPVGETAHPFRHHWRYQPGFTDPAGLDPAGRDIWNCLTQLHHTLAEAFHDR